MAKNTQSNKNIIQINNLVRMAEEKKRIRRRPRVPQAVPSEEASVPTQMQQQAPQIFQTLDTPQLRDVINEAIKSRAVQLNDMQRQDREARVAAQAAARNIADVQSQADQPFNQADSRAAEDSVRRGVSVTEQATQTFAGEENEEPPMTVEQGKEILKETKQRMAAKLRFETDYQNAIDTGDMRGAERLKKAYDKYIKRQEDDRIKRMQGEFYRQRMSEESAQQPDYVETPASAFV